MLARISRRKGVLELVEELAANPGLWSELLVAGGHEQPDYVAEIERRVSELGLAERVRLMGVVPDAFEFIGSLDAVVVPSTGTEGQPLTILEALACGRPAVVRAHAFPPSSRAPACSPTATRTNSLSRCRSSGARPGRGELSERFSIEPLLRVIAAARRA